MKKLLFVLVLLLWIIKNLYVILAYSRGVARMKFGNYSTRMSYQDKKYNKC